MGLSSSEKKAVLQDVVKPKWRELADRIIAQHRRGGRRAYTAEEVAEQFESYVDFCVSHKTIFSNKMKRVMSEKNGNVAEQSKQEVHTPMTVASFCVWLGVDTDWMDVNISTISALSLEDRTRNEQSLLDLLINIRGYLHSQLLEGALVGMYNPLLATCLLGLKRKTDDDGVAPRQAITPTITIMPETKTREDFALEHKQAEVIEESPEAEMVKAEVSKSLPGIDII